MRRREFIALAGSAAVWPIVARAQQTDKMRRIGVLTVAEERQFGIQGTSGCVFSCVRALRLDRRPQRPHRGTRQSGADIAMTRRYVTELVALRPDVIVVSGSQPAMLLLETTRRWAHRVQHGRDPVGAGIVNSLARPGGNATGFMLFEYTLSAKWAGTAQTDRAGRHAGGGAPRPHGDRRDRPVCRGAGDGIFCWLGSNPDQCARCAPRD